MGPQVKEETHMYDEGLGRSPANFAPLTPLGFLERSAYVHPSRPSIIHMHRVFCWRETYARCRQLASALSQRGIRKGDTVAVVAPNVPAVIEAHFGVPMVAAVLNTINIRLDSKTISLFFTHADAKLIIVDYEFLPLVQQALEHANRCLREASRDAPEFAPQLVVIEPEEGEEGPEEWRAYRAQSRLSGATFYEDLLREGDEEFPWQPPASEEDAISLNYTSGTTSAPKGVVFSHRGAHLSALSNLVNWAFPSAAVYLWTLPLFHCNGWCFAWACAAVSGTNVCLRQVSSKAIFALIAKHKVTHFCGAPVVLNFILNSPPQDRHPLPHLVNIMAAGAAPPPSVVLGVEAMGFRVTHTYGLTETYGPAAYNEWKSEWSQFPEKERAWLKGRQGVRATVLEGLAVMDPTTMTPVPADGRSCGEVMLRGNMVVKGYLKNPAATQEAFAGGWFHSGDVAVKHPDGYIEIKDRSKDVIISGGENISSIEVEAVLYRHPAIVEAAVVARPDEQWGETVCAFVGVKGGNEGVRSEDIINFCRENMPKYMCPRTVIFHDLPKTATGKVQKFLLRDKARALGSLSEAGGDSMHRKSKL